MKYRDIDIETIDNRHWDYLSPTVLLAVQQLSCGISVLILSVFHINRLRHTSSQSSSDTRPAVNLSHSLLHSRLKSHLFF